MNWISVNDILPELGQRCIVFGQYFDHQIYRVARRVPHESMEGWWKTDLGMLSPTEVTHWMPLPEPPKT